MLEMVLGVLVARQCRREQSERTGGGASTYQEAGDHVVIGVGRQELVELLSTGCVVEDGDDLRERHEARKPIRVTGKVLEVLLRERREESARVRCAIKLRVDVGQYAAPGGDLGELRNERLDRL